MSAAVDRVGARVSRIDPRASRNPRIGPRGHPRRLAKSCSFADPPPTDRSRPTAPTRADHPPRLPLHRSRNHPDPLRRRRGPEPQAGRDRRRAPAPDPAEARAGASGSTGPRWTGPSPGACSTTTTKKTHTVRWEQAAKNDGDDGCGPSEEVAWLSRLSRAGGAGALAAPAAARGAVALAADGDARGGREAHRRRHDQVDMLPGAQGGWTAGLLLWDGSRPRRRASRIGRLCGSRATPSTRAAPGTRRS